MNFSFDDKNPKKKGWALFLDVIKRYPVNQKAQKLVEDIKREKVNFSSVCFE